MKKTFGASLLMAGLALFTADNAVANDITIPAGVYTWSSLTGGSGPSGGTTPADTVTINGGGTLYVDQDATVGQITIGAAGTAGSLLFDSVSTHTLTVSKASSKNGSVVFGASGANSLNLLAGTVPHNLNVAGDFLATGSGTFTAGFSTVTLNGSGAQAVGGVSYKILTLAGSGVKTLASGVTIQTKLSLQGTATLAGTPVTYLSPASLEYNGTALQTTSPVEWPTSGMNNPIPVTIANQTTGGVKLDGSKQINSGGGTLTINSGAKLDVSTYILTADGAVVNNGTQTGSGSLILAGSTAQTLTGTGHYGNLTLNNSNSPNGVAAPATGLLVDGRLNLMAATALTVSGTASTATLLTINGTDQAVTVNTTYGSSASGASVQNNTYFAGTGILTLTGPKPASAFTVTAPTLTYGVNTLAISGTVGAAVLNNVGISSVNGEGVTVIIQTPSGPQTGHATTLYGNGSFEVDFSGTGTFPAGQYAVSCIYAGGINLGAVTSPTTLTVNPLPITVTPDNLSKTYGDSDPTLTYSYTPTPLLNSEHFTGTLTRAQAGTSAGNNVGSYAIVQGSLTLPANYTLTLTTGKTLTINPLAITVTANAKTKTYGDPDPAFDYYVAPLPLPYGDGFTGGLTRLTGSDVGSYTITRGTLTVTPLAANYNITYNPANLTITPKAVTVTVANANLSKIYGAADPTLTPIATPPLAYSDTFAGALHWNTGTTNAGIYTIDMGTLHPVNGLTDKSGDYTLTLGSTTFTINPAPLTITVNSQSIYYGAAIPSGVTYFGLAGSQTVPATHIASLTWDATPGTPTVGSLPGSYGFTVNQNAADANYTIAYSGNLHGTLTITKAPLTITAANKSKSYDGLVFSGGWTAGYTTLVAGDTADPATGSGTAFTAGALHFTGPALTAIAAGVYEIDVSSSPTLTSDKYGPITYVPGHLTITATETLAGDQTWGNSYSYNWEIDKANGGTAGSEPGWKLTHITPGTGPVTTGVLTIGADSGHPITIHMTTLLPGTSTAGSAAQFDPTRPYTWQFVQADGGITGFALNKFTLDSTGFANPVFGGTFSIANPSSTELDIVFTPTDQSVMDVTSVLASVTASDVDVLYLSPSTTSPSPQTPVTITLEVANLHEAVFGAQVFLAFDSTEFIASGTGAPVVAAGDPGTWDNLIWNTSNGTGKLDTVIGLDFNVPNGTMANGNVAYITLTPTRTRTGTSRLVFRLDLDTFSGGLVGGTYLSTLSGTSLPARVPTPDITIVNDVTGPGIGTVTATQIQYGTSQNVLNGPNNGSGSAPFSADTVRGHVTITVPASDAGVGLSATLPTVTLVGPGPSSPVTLHPINTATPFVYDWSVPVTAADNGVWNATVDAYDMMGHHNPTPSTFYLTVNNRQVTGLVELDLFQGTSRAVTFNAGDGSHILNTWLLPLSFTDPTFQSVGEFRQLPALATLLTAPPASDAVSTHLRYGSIANEQPIVTALLTGSRGVDTNLNRLFFGAFDTVAHFTGIVSHLTAPTTLVDSYIVSQLSPSTIIALGNYAAAATPSAAQIAAVKMGLLEDFNTIILGLNQNPPLYNALAFSTVSGVGTGTIDPTITSLLSLGSLTTTQLVQLNRLLLFYAYTGYLPGTLQAQTAEALANYAGGADANLASLVLQDFDTLENGPSLWNQPLFTYVRLRPVTQTDVLSPPTPLAKLNRELLEDAYAFSLNNLNYTSGLLSAATVAALGGSPSTLQPLLVADLNAQSIYSRSALETAYPTQITKFGSRAAYTLIDFPSTATQVSAKTAWNLRVTLTTLGGTSPNLVANFINNENDVVSTVVPQVLNYVFAAGDHYLRGGDIITAAHVVTGDNNVNLSDFTILQQNWLTPHPVADINGDGFVNATDYYIIKANYNGNGDPDVGQ